MRTLWQDVRYAVRTLRRNPTLTFVAVISLAFGIGANTAIFSLIDGMLLRTLPVRSPEQLVILTIPGGLTGFVETSYGDDVSFSWPKLNQLRERSSDFFDGLIARFPFSANIATGGQAERGRAELVSGNYFDVLGIRPALGRLFTNSDAPARGGNPVAVLSYGYWMRRFGGSPDILNKPITLNGRELTVVGVSQAGFRSIGAGEAPAVFVPITMQPLLVPTFDQLDNPHAYWMNAFGRLKPGISRERAEAGLAPIWSAILAGDVKQLPTQNSGAVQRYLHTKLRLQPAARGLSQVRADFEFPLYVLMGMVGLVLLIACANVANLLLARAAARQKELAIRISLGASRARLVRHVLTESSLLAVGGGLLGLFISTWLGALILRLVPAEIPMSGITTDPDGRVLAFALIVSMITGLLFGSVPAFRATRPDVAPALKEQTATPTGGGHARFRKAVVCGQIGLSVLLLASAGLFAHSLYNIRNVNPGFRTDHLLTFSIRAALNGYKPERTRRLLDDVRHAVSSMPGVIAASLTTEPVLSNSISQSGYDIEGYQTAGGERVALSHNSVGPGYFSVMGIPLVAGREFRDSDAVNSLAVAVVNESLADKYFNGRNPIGLHLIYGRKDPRAIEIVGVVKDSKYDDIREKPKPFVFLPILQESKLNYATFYVRTSLPPGSFAKQLRELIRRFDPTLPVTDPTTMREDMLQTVYLDRLTAALSLGFAALATVLAAVGLYGVVAWAVTRRRREIGIRMALGAHASDVMRMVMAEVLWLGAVGIAVAAPVWVAAARIISSQLYGVSSHDPLALSASVILLSLVAGIAGFIPAYRAARLDPISAIRYE